MRNLRDPTDIWWTIDEAAEHLGVTTASIRRYIRAGLTLHLTAIGGFLNRTELLAEYQKRQTRQRETRHKPNS